MDVTSRTGIIERNTIYVSQIDEVKFVPIVVLGMRYPELVKIYQSIKDGTMDSLPSSEIEIYIDDVRLTHLNAGDYQLLRETSTCEDSE